MTTVILPLQHIMLRQGKVPLAADAEVVVDREVQGLGGFYQGLG